MRWQLLVTIDLKHRKTAAGQGCHLLPHCVQAAAAVVVLCNDYIRTLDVGLNIRYATGPKPKDAMPTSSPKANMPLLILVRGGGIRFLICTTQRIQLNEPKRLLSRRRVSQYTVAYITTRTAVSCAHSTH
jgi:hypothetical protein